MIRDEESFPASVNGRRRVDLPLSGEAEVADVLNGLVVVSVGRGGAVHAAVNRALKAARHRR